MECLDALFGDKVPGPIENYLAKTKSPKDTTILKKLLEWARGIHAMFVKDGETSVEFGAHTHSTCVSDFAPADPKRSTKVSGLQ